MAVAHPELSRAAGADLPADPVGVDGNARQAASWRWPLGLLAAWGLGWLLQSALRAAGTAQWVAAAAGLALVLLLARRAATPLRRSVVALGYPLSWLAAGTALPGWAWGAALAALLLLYPRRAWRDAPLFPTPAGALDGLAAAAPLAAGVRVLDAGCGLGDGLLALRRAYPQAQIEGIESSLPLLLAARLRCRFARLCGGDLWRRAWSGYALVYLFQRPESMAPAWAKACAEMAPGSRLASLEFAVPGVEPEARLACAGGRLLWLYRVPPPGGVSSAATPRR